MESNKDIRPKTIICDIDGTLVMHESPVINTAPDHKLRICSGVLEKFKEWDRKGYYIVLITGRKESLRENTIRQLSEVGIFYDQLVMGVGGGPRTLINDMKEDGTQTAFAINVERDKGLEDISI